MVIEKNAKRGGLSFLTLLGLLFVGLKLSGHLDWSWWAVLLPFYIGPLLLALLIIGVIIVALFNTPIKK